MNQTTRLEWGLLPIPEGEYIAVWSARAILECGEISLLLDRQQMSSGNEAEVFRIRTIRCRPSSKPERSRHG